VDNQEQLARRLTESGEGAAAYFQSLSPAQWQVRVYSGDAPWTVRDLLAHFVSAERGYLRYLRGALAGDGGVPEDFDIDSFNAAEIPRWRQLPVEELLREFRLARHGMADLTLGLTPDDLERLAHHPWFGLRPIAWYLQLCYNHNSMHLRDIRRAINGHPNPPAQAPPRQ
jgi:hypothetical protein